MENHSEQLGKQEASVQWHTLSENLMDLGSENTEPHEEAYSSSLSQRTIQSQEPRANQSAPAEQQEPVEIRKTSSGRKKKPVGPIVAAVIVILLVCGAAAFYFTVHRWTEPSCTEASVCTICGKTGSPAAGHLWTPATCTAPKTCGVCHETEGTPLEHDLKDEVSYDFIKCAKESWNACSQCEYRTSSKSEQLTSFLDEKKEFFLMSPNAFKERLEYLSSQFDPEDVLYDGIAFDDMKNVSFRWADDDTSGAQGSSSTGWPILECYSGSEILLTIRLYDLNADSTAEVDRNCPSSFNCILMSGSNSSKKAALVYHSLELILVTTCDPEVPGYGVTVVLLAADANSGGNTEHNGLVYGASDTDYNIVTRKMVEKIRWQNS